ncbi:MAG TPA: porin family protein [Usitatibacter sp.]|nr:porin family protein [Usitatibacter sp.]
MKTRAFFRGLGAAGLLWVSASAFAADDPAIESARRLLAAGNAKQAYTELAAVEGRLSGMPEFDYLFGVAALDSGKIEDAIIAFERVLAVLPNHAGAQMDLARAYYAAGSFDLAEAAFLKLRAANPPPAAQIAINRYLEAINTRKQQLRPGWTAFGELGLGYDSNITGVPANFFAASQQSVGIGFDPTGNSLKRSAPFAQGAVGAQYYRPLSRGWSLFTGGELRGRAYRHESDFNLASGEVHLGGALNAGDDQYRGTVSYSPFSQKGAAPGDPKPTNDRRIAGINLDWRHAVDTKTQVGVALQVNDVRFPKNKVEDFDQLFLSASWLRSFEGRGSPLLYLTGFVTEDRARNEFDNGIDGRSSKSKNLVGARSYFQYALSPKLQAFNSIAAIYRRDKDDWARSNLVRKGHDAYGEVALGVLWTFREKCVLRLQYAYSRNASNIDIYDFNRNEISSTIRCDMI